MASSAAVALNNSARTIADVRRLAEQSPEEAANYLRRVSENLRRVGDAQSAEALERVISGAGSLVERMQQNAQVLSLVFPESPQAWWGDLQAHRASSIGWTADPQSAKPLYLEGTVSKGPDNYLQLTTTGGKTYQLAESTRVASYYNMVRSWMQGLIGDGPMSLTGSLAIDGRTFNVEGFALNRDGRFSTFTFGRVNADDPNRVVISTPRGDVEITHPELKAKLKAMPRLGIILPGEPVEQNGKLVYDQNPADFFALARFMEQAVRDAEPGQSGKWVSTDMAYSKFARKPCYIPEEAASRVNHGGRLWVLGNVELGEDGTAVRFKSSYVSLQTDYGGAQLKPAVPEADVVQAAVMLAEATSH